MNIFELLIFWRSRPAMPASGLTASTNTRQRITDRFAPVTLPNWHLQAALSSDPARIPDSVQEIPGVLRNSQILLCRQTKSYPETALEEIHGDLFEPTSRYRSADIRSEDSGP